MQPELVDDFEDPRLADYRNLKDATLATARGRFIVEGRGTLEVLLTRSRYRPDSILLSERTFRAVEADLARLDPNCPIFVGQQSVLDRIVGFPIHRGCLASCTRDELADPIDLARQVLEREASPRLIVLDGLTNLDNVGLIFRNAMALGAHAVLLCARTCDPLYRKAIRTSMGGSLCVPFARARDLPKMLTELRALGYSVLAFDPDETAIEVRRVDVRRLGPAALLFGTEGSGLRESVLAAADDRVRIAMEPDVDSLNVAVTAGIALSLLRRDAPEVEEASSSQEKAN